MAVGTVKPLNKPHEEWRGLVSPAAYKVLFEEDTEPPGSSLLNREDREGHLYLRRLLFAAVR